MKVTVLNEAGYEEALLGLSLSYESRTPAELAERGVDQKLAKMDGGHNKFLESIMVWLDVTAPRYWWQEADTYRLSTKQSASTMHTIMKRPLAQSDFQGGIPYEYLDFLNELVSGGEFVRLKQLLPESFLQRRIWCVSYKTLRNIFLQREMHKLPEWRQFIKEVRSQVKRPWLLPEDRGVN